MMSEELKTQRYIWLNGDIVALDKATIHILSPTAQYGINVFEGIRCYWNADKNQLFGFRVIDHHKRLLESARILRLESKFTLTELGDELIRTIRANDLFVDISVRQTIFLYGDGNWSAQGPTGMFIAPVVKERTNINYIKGINCCVSSWQRISDRDMPPRAKVGANYVNSRLAQVEAKMNNYDSAILLNHKGTVSEGPGSCVFIVKNGLLITPPSTSSTLDSITKDTIIRISKDLLNIRTVERDIERTELYTADEIFLCGSAVEILPVTMVDGMGVGYGNVGVVTIKVLAAYLKVVSGEISEYNSWLTSIY